MPILVVIVAPCHQLFDNQENDDCGDIILHGQDVMAILDIKKGPEPGVVSKRKPISEVHGSLRSDHGIYDSKPTIKWQFSNLRCWKFAVTVSELDNGAIGFS